MDIHYSCTVCGKCCQNLKLPLTIAEATRWLTDGKDLQVLCEALPWGAEPPADDLQAAHRRRRSFPAMSGSLPMRVIVILAVNFAGDCPYLKANRECGIYPERPLVCRIYPAEINPFVELKPGNKACPPEAWTPDRPLFQRDGRLMDSVVQRNITESRDTDVRDVEAKRRLCAALALNRAAVMGEGFTAYAPSRAELLAQLTRPAEPRDAAGAAVSWEFVSNQAATVEALVALGAAATAAPAPAGSPFEYLALRPASIRQASGAPALGTKPGG